MPQDPNKRRQLYDALSSSGFQLPAYEQFDVGLSDPKRRKQLYDALQQNEFQLPEYSVFESQLGGVVSQQPVSQQERPLYRGILGAVDQPSQTLARGVQRARSGNIPAGGADIASALFQSPGVRSR